ncbi:uncharacterized protein LOC129583803 [Paramacrobiotus metropolitanus]|uniref:uncharacterized protein LOC129583803 n=1 Tax=Paramacrobiotus metropolitanus TaxID=2943436 RepID=UPI0024461E01|nr:uncharacterized protein LOC129583803 [Paramacrobiotus metropolitanus]
MDTILANLATVGLGILFFAGAGAQLCNPGRCLSAIPNIFLRPQSAYLLRPEQVDEFCGPTIYGKLLNCWTTECRNAVQVDRGIRDLIEQSTFVLTQLCTSIEARTRLTAATGQCRIYYPHDLAPKWPEVFSQCPINPLRGKRAAPTVTEADSGWKWPSTHEHNNPYALSGPPVVNVNYRPPNARPVTTFNENLMTGEAASVAVVHVGNPVGLGFTQQDTDWQFWPVNVGLMGVGDRPLTTPVLPGNLAAPPSWPLLFSGMTSSGGGVLPAVGACLEVSRTMDCTLSRSCLPQLAQVIKPLAMMYLGCASAVPASVVCDGRRVHYCMWLSGGSPFEVFEPTRYIHYCQSSDAVIECIERDCPEARSDGPVNLDLQFLASFKKFLRNYCQNLVYQNAVALASTNCPIFRNVSRFPATDDSVRCANQLLQSQGKETNPCNIYEAQTHCLALNRRCDFAHVNPQKSVLLEMMGCPGSGVLQYSTGGPMALTSGHPERPSATLRVIIIVTVWSSMLLVTRSIIC